MDVRVIGLNLLVLFDALIKDCRLTRAAEAIGFSQPAMSTAVLRLRGVMQSLFKTQART